MLPIKLPLDMMQTRWKSELDPVLANPMTNASILKSVKLISGTNVINHLLGRKQQGWFLTDVDAVVSVYRSAQFNNLTLTLTSSGSAVVDIAVF